MLSPPPFPLMDCRQPSLTIIYFRSGFCAYLSRPCLPKLSRGKPNSWIENEYVLAFLNIYPDIYAIRERRGASEEQDISIFEPPWGSVHEIITRSQINGWKLINISVAASHERYWEANLKRDPWGIKDMSLTDEYQLEICRFRVFSPFSINESTPKPWGAWICFYGYFVDNFHLKESLVPANGSSIFNTSTPWAAFCRFYMEGNLFTFFPVTQ